MQQKTRKVWVSADGEVFHRKPDGWIRTYGGWLIFTVSTVFSGLLVLFFASAFVARWTDPPTWLIPVVEVAAWINALLFSGIAGVVG